MRFSRGVGVDTGWLRLGEADRTVEDPENGWISIGKP